MWVWCACIHCYLSYAAVSLGVVPEKEALEGVPLFSKGNEAVTVDPKESQESLSARVAQQTNTLMSLIKAHESQICPKQRQSGWERDSAQSQRGCRSA